MFLMIMPISAKIPSTTTKLIGLLKTTKWKLFKKKRIDQITEKRYLIQLDIIEARFMCISQILEIFWNRKKKYCCHELFVMIWRMLTQGVLSDIKNHADF